MNYQELDDIFEWCEHNNVMFTPHAFGDPYCLLLSIEDDKLITYAALKWGCEKFEFPVRGIL